MVNLRSLSLCVLAGAFILSTASNAQQAASNAHLSASARITTPIDENQLVTLSGNVHPAATAKNDRGPVSAALPMSGLVLVLSRSPEKQAAFDAYVESEYDSGSPNFHQWLMPDAIGEQFGPSKADVATVTGWLAGHGFAVSQVSKDRLAITFSGTASQVQSAFHTSIHNLSVNGKTHIANMGEPQIPAALAPVVVGVKQLHDFFPRPMHRVGSVVQFNPTAGKWQRAGSVPGFSDLHGLARIGAARQSSTSLSSASPRPEFGLGGTSSSGPFFDEEVAPLDFATIYNVTPVWNESITGANQTIAIVGTSDICLGQTAAPCSLNNDVSKFRSTFGLPAGVAPILDAGVNGHDPGVCTGTTNACNGDDLLENSLDVEWSGAVAPGAQIVLVTSGGTGTNDPISDDAQFIVNNHGSTSSTTSIKDIANANIISISYGNCELGVGTANNVAYYHLWQQAASEGISVFIATGDSGAPACDEGGDSQNGNPYSAQFGLAVSGLASTPFDVAVGGTDFSWCKPTYNSQGNVVGCPGSPSAAGPVWNPSNSASNGYESAAGYVPETPWNDSCMNPIWAAYVESLEPLTGFGTGPSNPEGACDYVQNEWQAIDQQQEQASGNQFVLAGLVDTVGAGGGASNCVVNDIATDPNNPTCTANSTTTGTANGSIALTNDGWQKPSWQTGITPNDGVRDLPDVSFFAGDGALDSATLVCVTVLQGSACSVGSGSISNSNSTTALEVGGTSVATPEMAGVMALINQKAGSPQGLPNKELYALAGLQTSATCSSETVTDTTAGCYFNDVDQGTIDMPCDNGASIGGATFDPQTGGWVIGQPIAGDVGLNCAALNSGDTVGSLVTSGTNVGYDAGAGYDLATGLGSLNVAHVVNAWSSNAGTATATIAAQLSASTIAANVPLTVTATVSGSSSTPTGTVTVTGSGAGSSGTLAAGVATITIPANTLAAGTDTLTVTYSGDGTYASANTTAAVTVTAVANGTYSLTAGNPASTAQGATATSTITGTSSNGYTGKVTFSSCTQTAAPPNAVNLPTCSASGSITFTAGTATGTGTATVTTFSNQAMLETRPAGKGWLGASGGAVLAFLVFLGVPSRRRSWRAMLGLVVLLASLGGLSACGGGSVNKTPPPTSTATTAGNYKFSVSGQGNDSAHTAATASFTVTVN